MTIKSKSQLSLSNLDLLFRSLDLLMKLKVVNVEIPRNMKKTEVMEIVKKYYKKRLKGVNISCSIRKLFITINMKTMEIEREYDLMSCSALMNGQ